MTLGTNRVSLLILSSKQPANQAAILTDQASFASLILSKVIDTRVPAWTHNGWRRQAISSDPGREVLMAILIGPILGTAGDLRDLKPVSKHSSMQAEDTDTPGYGTA